MNTIMTCEEQTKELEVMKNMAAIAMRSGKFSSDYNEGTIINIFYTAKAFKIDPFYALNGAIQIVKGKINMSAHLMSALARRAGHSIKVVEQNEKLCVIIAKRKDNDDSLKYEMTIEEAARAGLTGKDNWKNNAKQMLYCACMRNVFRMLFSDIAIPYDADEMNVEEAKEIDEVKVVDSESIAMQPKQEKKEEIAKKTPVEPSSAMTPLEELKEHLEIDGISSDKLEEWIDMRCKMKNKSQEAIIADCLNAKMLPNFKNIYSKWLASQEKSSPQELIAV